MMAAAVKPSCAALTLLAALAAAPAALAQPAGSLWSQATRPGDREALAARQAGEWLNLLDLLPEPQRARLAPERADIDHESLRAEALAHFERALALRPDDPRALAAAAHLRERHNDLDGAARDAARSLELDPEGPAAQDAHFTLAVVHTWRGEHPAARDHYLALLRLPITGYLRSMVLGNLGDEFQALGDVGAAIDSYVACVTLRPGYALGWLGLAIARDRAHLDPAPDAAMAVRTASDDVRARMRALRMGPGFDPGALIDALSSEGVFYVPAYDRFYYQGVAHEAVARAWSAGNEFGVAPVASEADAHRRAAAVAWRRYLDGAAPDDPWRGRAEAHLRALGGAPR
ncbi:MAG: tetratricopeptide repeat protein [Deltaproteobacteria bacterium]|nr:tetratricopeptide repeat protein [Myxococcales bacterium]MDP3214867.1 tetratricopeptide repeat protein [Deltaproteobacteria bacterium]